MCKQEKRKYPTKQELIERGYEVPGAMILNVCIDLEIEIDEIIKELKQ